MRLSKFLYEVYKGLKGYVMNDNLLNITVFRESKNTKITPYHRRYLLIILQWHFIKGKCLKIERISSNAENHELLKINWRRHLNKILNNSLWYLKPRVLFKICCWVRIKIFYKILFSTVRSFLSLVQLILLAY